MGKQKPENLLVHGWYKKSFYLYLLFPITVIYALLSALRRAGYRLGLFRRYKAPVPVVVVGNINVGGTGKTPLVIALVKALQTAGMKPGIISRGYGSKAPVYPYHIQPDDNPEHSGDEPLLLALRTGVPVVIDGNRQRAIEALLAAHQCDVIISDDGLQHYALQRDMEIAVVDSKRLFGNRLLLPAGPLRETVGRLQSVDFIISNGGAIELDFSTPHFVMQLKPVNIVSLDGQCQLTPEQWCAEQDSKLVHAVAGIGNPGRFYQTLRQLGLTPLPHSFPDHHPFQQQDFDFDDELPVLMTEKDAVKARRVNLQKNCWYLSVTADIDKEFFSSLLAKIDRLN